MKNLEGELFVGKSSTLSDCRLMNLVGSGRILLVAKAKKTNHFVITLT